MFNNLNDKTKKRIAIFMFLLMCPTQLFVLYLSVLDITTEFVSLILCIVVPFFEYMMAFYLLSKCKNGFYERKYGPEMNLVNIDNYETLKERLLANLIQHGIDDHYEFEDIQTIQLSNGDETIIGFKKGILDIENYGFQIVKMNTFKQSTVNEALNHFWVSGKEKAKLEENREQVLAKLLIIIVEEDNEAFHKYLRSSPMEYWPLNNYDLSFPIPRILLGIAMKKRIGYIYQLVRFEGTEPSDIYVSNILRATIKDVLINKDSKNK